MLNKLMLLEAKRINKNQQNTKQIRTDVFRIYIERK